MNNAADAAELAEQVGADIVVYGALTPGQNDEKNFVPQFYVESAALRGARTLGQSADGTTHSNSNAPPRYLFAEKCSTVGCRGDCLVIGVIG